MSILFSVVVGTVVLIIFLVAYHFLLGAPYVPSTDKRIKRVVTLASINNGDGIAELGSGDGRVVIALAQAGGIVDGYEISPYLVWKSRRLIQRLGLSKRATIFHKNFWNADLSKYDIIVLYGIQYIMPRLEKKLLQELRSEAKIISVYFTFPTLKPTRSLKDVHLYTIPTGFRISARRRIPE